MTTLFALAVAASTIMGQPTDLQASSEEFQEFGNLLAGRWIGDIKFIFDWPGQEKGKGDRITSYDTYKWIADNKGIEWEGFGGTVTGKTLIVWDAPSKQIKAFHVGSAGGTWQTIIWKETHEKWGWKFTGGGLADGRKFAGQGHWIFSEGGKKLTIAGDITLGDEKLDRFDDKYRRVDK